MPATYDHELIRDVYAAAGPKLLEALKLCRKRALCIFPQHPHDQPCDNCRGWQMADDVISEVEDRLAMLAVAPAKVCPICMGRSRLPVGDDGRCPECRDELARAEAACRATKAPMTDAEFVAEMDDDDLADTTEFIPPALRAEAARLADLERRRDLIRRQRSHEPAGILDDDTEAALHAAMMDEFRGQPGASIVGATR